MAKKTLKKSETNSNRAMLRKLPFYDKYLLTVAEAACYFHIGDKKMYDLIHEHEGAKWIVRVGQRLMVKKELFARWLDSQEEI